MKVIDFEIDCVIVTWRMGSSIMTFTQRTKYHRVWSRTPSSASEDGVVSAWNFTETVRTGCEFFSDPRFKAMYIRSELNRNEGEIMNRIQVLICLVRRMPEMQVILLQVVRRIHSMQILHGNHPRSRLKMIIGSSSDPGLQPEHKRHLRSGN